MLADVVEADPEGVVEAPPLAAAVAGFEGLGVDSVVGSCVRVAEGVGAPVEQADSAIGQAIASTATTAG